MVCSDGQMSFLDSGYDPKKLTRRTDPSTSKEAADHVVSTGILTGQCELVFKTICDHPDHTATELAEIYSTEHDLDAASAMLIRNTFHRRMAKLRDGEGSIIASGTKACNVTGRRATTWRKAPS